MNLDEEVNQEESNIDTQLQRRNDLIPNLVNTVEGYASHEEEILQRLQKRAVKSPMLAM